MPLAESGADISQLTAAELEIRRNIDSLFNWPEGTTPQLGSAASLPFLRRMRATMSSNREGTSSRFARERRSLREMNQIRETNMNHDRVASERGPSSNLAPRVIYDSALAGDLRHARDGGLHDWVTTNPPPPPPPPSGPHVHPPWQHQGGDGGGDTRPLPQQQQALSSVTGSENIFRPLNLPPLRLEPGPPSTEMRTSALTQAIRRHSRITGRTPRTGLESYVLDRARRVEEGESEPSRHTARLLRPPSMIQPSERRQGIPTAELRTTMDTYRQRYLQNPSSVSVDGGGPLEQAIRYLERVRDPQPGDEDLVAMCARYFADLAYLDPEMGKDLQDVVVNARSISGPAETSWLRIGSVFEGTQHAAGIPNSLRRRLSSHLSSSSGLGGSNHTNNNNNNIESRGSTPDASAGGGGAATTGPSSALADNHVSLRYLMDSQCCCIGDFDGTEHFDKWPVKVTIHSIDYETMQLAGEMEAFDVPDRTAPEYKSSITTFLEGEMIDFTHHTLRTKNYRSSPRIDSIYWQKLLPFRGHDEREVCHWLLSKKWLEEHLSKEWILMRWKGILLIPFFPPIYGSFFLKKNRTGECKMLIKMI
ncbi:MAG: hypothetical protein M1823_003601 [Watsoniomyces obsoletus]|nr:MAG: hypothetical protein M1823_003601 [Watsoniomyces obsoletus]